MFCGLPSSSSLKSSFLRPSTGLPDLSRTKQFTITSVLLLVNVTVSSFFCCACCGRARAKARKSRRKVPQPKRKELDFVICAHTRRAKPPAPPLLHARFGG